MALLEDGLALVGEPLARADLHAARAYVLRAQGRLEECIETCLAEADRVEPLDAERAAKLLSPVAEFAFEKFELDRAREPCGRLSRLLGSRDRRRAPAALAQLTWQDLVDARPTEALRTALRGARLELERSRLSESAARDSRPLGKPLRGRFDEPGFAARDRHPLPATIIATSNEGKRRWHTDRHSQRW